MFKRALAYLVLIALALTVSTASADVPISGLPSVTTPAGADSTVIVHSGTTSKATLTAIFANAPQITSLSPATVTQFNATDTITGVNANSGSIVNANSQAPNPLSAVYSTVSALGSGDAKGMTMYHDGTGYGVGFVTGSGDRGFSFLTFPTGSYPTLQSGFTRVGRIDASGNAIFTVFNASYNGTSTAPGNTANFGVDASADGVFRINNSTANFQFKNDNTGGYAPISGGVYTNASDRRWKKDIRPIGYGLDAVEALKPSAFVWKSSSKHDLGFIAQDVRQVLPELVTADNRGYLGVNYSGIIPVLTRAIQEQQDEIDTLKRELKQRETPAPHESFLGRLHWLFLGA
jgi:hypothetical protein